MTEDVTQDVLNLMSRFLICFLDSRCVAFFSGVRLSGLFVQCRCENLGFKYWAER